MRSSRTAAVCALLLAASVASAQTNPSFVNPGSIRVDDPKGSVMLLADADRGNLAQPLGTVHLRYYQGWTLADPKTKVPADPSVFSPGPTMRARVGSQVSILFLNRIDDANFSYTYVTEKDGKGNLQAGCDEASNPAVYPAKDIFPNCFHGSSTANIHFHGTHTNPDGLGDNVLVQVMPDRSTSEETWIGYFNEVLAKKSIPKTWAELPSGYRNKQATLVKAQGEGLWNWDKQQIALGQWPQYIAGAYFNIFKLPEYTEGGPYKAGQAPGTHWYHAHKHGSTALQSLNGMAGTFIIEGAYDDFLRGKYKIDTPAKLDAFEKVLVFQLINPTPNLERTNVNFGSIGPGVLVLNGLNTPVITMKPGEVQLWRIVNATTGSGFKGITNFAGPGIIMPDLFQTTGFTILQTSKDGVQFSPANYKNQPFLNKLVPNQFGAPNGLLLAGGNRADVLVQAPTTVPTTNPVPFTSGGGTLFYVNVAGSAVDMSLPTATEWPAMPAYLNDLPQPKNYPHQVTFGWDPEPGRPAAQGARLTSNVGLNLPPRYTIDNRQFEQNGPLVDQCMPLDGLQEWVLLNQTTVTHPFHIHINPFQVTKIEVPTSSDGTSFSYTTYAPKDNFWWGDVINIPAGVALSNGQFLPGKVTIRQQFVDFTGTWVLHCHILAHEDRGMMQLVRVVPSKRYPGDCQQAIPHHH